jgi:hypothetical protein
MSGFSPKRKAVQIIDPTCADPYFVSKIEYASFADEYKKLGCRVVIGDQETLI